MAWSYVKDFIPSVSTILPFVNFQDAANEFLSTEDAMTNLSKRIPAVVKQLIAFPLTLNLKKRMVKDEYANNYIDVNVMKIVTREEGSDRGLDFVRVFENKTPGVSNQTCGDGKDPYCFRIPLNESKVKGIRHMQEILGIGDDDSLLKYMVAAMIEKSFPFKIGIAENGTPTETSFCENTVLKTTTLVSTEATPEEVRKDPFYPYTIRFTALASRLYGSVKKYPPTVRGILNLLRYFTLRCVIKEYVLRVVKKRDLPESKKGDDSFTNPEQFFDVVRSAFVQLRMTSDELRALFVENDSIREIQKQMIQFYKKPNETDEEIKKRAELYFNILDTDIVETETKGESETDDEDQPTYVKFTDNFWKAVFPPFPEEYETIVSSLRTGEKSWLDWLGRRGREALLISYAVAVGTVLGSIVFRMWYVLRKRAVLEKYPDRRQLIERANNLFSQRSNQEMFMLLRSTLIKRRLSKQEWNSIMKIIKEYEGALLINKLSTETTMPLSKRHYAMGIVVYIWLLNYVIRFAYDWLSPTVPTLQAEREKAWKRLFIGSVKTFGLLKFKMLWGLVSQMEGLKTYLLAFMAILLGPNIVGMLKILYPIPYIRFLASIFSFIEYSARDVWSLIASGGDFSKLNRIDKRMKSVKRFVDKKMELIRKKRELFYDKVKEQQKKLISPQHKGSGSSYEELYEEEPLSDEKVRDVVNRIKKDSPSGLKPLLNKQRKKK